MLEPTIAAVMVPVTNVAEALDWYERAFPGAIRSSASNPKFEFLVVRGVRIELVPSDAKMPSGPGGSVVYWRVPQLEPALQHLESLGARLYRGPLKIEGGQVMCQVQDPWGNCIGLRGLSLSAGSAP
jgi:predicted enzyme related to lactoylglutathione lyase